VGISCSESVDINLVNAAIDSESWDWFRYSWFCYVLWTTSDAETVCRKILRVPGLQGCSVLVCALDMGDGFGSLPSEMWDWLKKDRGFGQLEFWAPPDIVQPSTPLLPETKDSE
jgi:hypothetical protein